MTSIHQLVPALHSGDAIGDSARAMRDYIQARGYSSNIYAYDIDEKITGEALPFRAVQPDVSENDVLILHYALPSGMTEFVKRQPCKKALIYHNITPAFYWMPYDPDLVHLASAGRRELASLSSFIDRSAGDSEYNRLELEQLSFRDTCVLPIYVKQERYRVPTSPVVEKTLEKEWFHFLYVGRVAPNKKLEDILRVHYCYKKYHSALARVIFVGKPDVTPGYFAALKNSMARMGIMDDEVRFTGHVDWPELVAYYKGSDVFISMSEHEGFCVPLVESMICGTPIVAYSSTAVPYTLGDAGVQFKTKDYEQIAAVCHRIATEPEFRSSVLQTQQKQLEKYSEVEIEKAVQKFLEPLLQS